MTNPYREIVQTENGGVTTTHCSQRTLTIFIDGSVGTGIEWDAK